MPKRKKKKISGKAGWRINGSRIYHVKGKRTSRKKTYASKNIALAARKHKG